MSNSKFSIGYQLMDYDSIPDIVNDYREHISEVYFAYPGDPSGRSPLVDTSIEDFWEDIHILNEMGVGLTLLFNAACYGEKVVSKELIKECRDKVKTFKALKAITTTSPFIAKELKKEFPELEIRASVNMRIGTIKAMEYLYDCFDGFYIQRDNQRNLEYTKRISEWCRANGKSIHMLANSGCLYNCSFQSFHDNAVAHEVGISKKDNVMSKYPSPCWELMANEEKRHWVLQNTWIRPEDLHHYESYFDTIKLATRLHHNPRMVINSYVNHKHYGSLLDLMEPSFSSVFAPDIVDNLKFPEDWFEQTSTCLRNCDTCTYCKEVFDRLKTF